MADTLEEDRRALGFHSKLQYGFVKALQLARAGLVTNDSELFLKGVNGIRQYATLEGLSPWDLAQIARIMKFLFGEGGGASNWADGLATMSDLSDGGGLKPNIGERMAKMMTDLIAIPETDMSEVDQFLSEHV